MREKIESLIPETTPDELAIRLKDKDVVNMLGRHREERRLCGLDSIYVNEIGNDRFFDSSPKVLRQIDHFAKIAVEKYIERYRTLSIDAPVLVSCERFSALPDLDIPESTNWTLVKISPDTGKIIHGSEMDVYSTSTYLGANNPHKLNSSMLDMVFRHYQEQTDQDIVLRGQYPDDWSL